MPSASCRPGASGSSAVRRARTRVTSAGVVLGRQVRRQRQIDLVPPRLTGPQRHQQIGRGRHPRRAAAVSAGPAVPSAADSPARAPTQRSDGLLRQGVEARAERELGGALRHSHIGRGIGSGREGWPQPPGQLPAFASASSRLAQQFLGVRAAASGPARSCAAGTAPPSSASGQNASRASERKRRGVRCAVSVGIHIRDNSGNAGLHR